jgi:hypothetical protein
MRSHTNGSRYLALGSAAFGVITVLLLLMPSASAAATNTTTLSPYGPGGPISPLLAQSEMMPAFLNGKVVNTVYQQGYFVGTYQAPNKTFGMEPLAAIPSIGVNATHQPAPFDDIRTLWVLVPWWGPSNAPYAPAYDPAAYGIQLHCAPASVAVCFDHPATLNVPGLGVVPLPGHDHLISTWAAGQDIWWNVAVDLVYNASAFPDLNASSGITSLADLVHQQSLGTVSPDLSTNLFLNFRVLPPTGVHVKPVSFPQTPVLKMDIEMPVFYNGHVVPSFYENGYFTGSNVSYNSSYGSQPLLAMPELGTAPTTFPAAKASIEPFYVLVPWWGPASAPYAPSYDPSAYGITEHCAPANIAVCWDHPATINVPGLGVVPLPGHDHLVGTVAGHQDIWWNVVVVLVLNQTAWPAANASSGIVSTADLAAAQTAGTASADLPTNVFLNFWI